jgi:ribosomal-protein-serine acetyltransferase
LNREYLAQWLPWVENSLLLVDTQQFIRSELDRFAKNNGFTSGIFYNNTLVGCIGVHEISWNQKKTSLGYWLGAHIQEKGL